MIRPASCEAALARIHLAAATAAEHELRQSVIAAGLQASQVRFSLARARRRTDQARERLAQAGSAPATRHRARIAEGVGRALEFGALSARLAGRSHPSSPSTLDLCLRIQLLLGCELRHEQSLLDGVGRGHVPRPHRPATPPY